MGYSWSDWHSIAFLLLAGLGAFLWGWWTGHRVTRFRQDSLLYRRFEAQYRFWHWRRQDDFGEVADGYIRRHAKRAMVVGILAAILAVLLGVLEVLGY